MAWFQGNFASQSLNRQVSVNVLIPADMRLGVPKKQDKPFKTIYLLHGFTGDCSDWITGTSIGEISQMYDFAVVMPSGENSFYVDIERSGRLYSTFIGKELVEFTRKIFPLSHERDDTIVAGLSMGGYGALYNGLKHHETFGHTIALSSALVADRAKDTTDEPSPMGATRGYFEETFGDLDELENTDKNLRVLAKRVLEKGKDFPNLYFTCGYNDMLVYGNRALSAYMNEIGFKHIYEEGAGTHEWRYWDAFLRRGLKMLGLLPDIELMKPPFWVDAEKDSPNPVTP
ncbi:MAG: alpha/beta hydrolase-fold protein [Oscillospiraceae bacterium]|nr:alpha/beta hydrolase-fold protein [Oscillospiraceae bacterium]